MLSLNLRRNDAVRHIQSTKLADRYRRRSMKYKPVQDKPVPYRPHLLSSIPPAV